MYLNSDQLNNLIDEEKLIIRPLLEKNQISGITIDFRLGSDFLVSIRGRSPFIDASINNGNFKPVSSMFQESRRKIGESFILYPHQTILTTSLEYIKLPNNITIDLTMRSSYARMGITISTIVQPGYAGCISLELTNINLNPIKLTVGSRLFQGRFIKLEEDAPYFDRKRKYICSVRPEVSAVTLDEDLIILKKIYEGMNSED